MSKYFCYDDENAEESDAREIADAYDDYSAAEQFAEQQNHRGSFDSDTMSVKVRRDGQTTWRRFTVLKEIAIDFNAIGNP